MRRHTGQQEMPHALVSEEGDFPRAQDCAHGSETCTSAVIPNSLSQVFFCGAWKQTQRSRARHIVAISWIFFFLVRGYFVQLVPDEWVINRISGDLLRICENRNRTCEKLHICSGIVGKVVRQTRQSRIGEVSMSSRIDDSLARMHERRRVAPHMQRKRTRICGCRPRRAAPAAYAALWRRICAGSNEAAEEPVVFCLKAPVFDHAGCDCTFAYAQ